jgi:hypothetical protein
MMNWFSCAGPLLTFTAGTLPSTVAAPPPPRVLVELYHSGHPSPRHVVRQNPRELLHPSLPLDLTAGDHRRRNMAAPTLLCSGSQPKDPGLEESKVQGVMCTTVDSDE